MKISLMRKVFRRRTGFVLVGVVVLLFGFVLPALAESFTNPIIAQRADPSIYKHTDGFYYLTYSVPQYDRIELRRATTIQGLGSASATVIWTKHSSGVMSANIWAPWIDFNNGTWYVYFAAAQTSANFNHRIYALSNSSANPLQGSWTERGQIVMNWESFTLDPTTFVHNNVRYMVWGQKDPAIQGNSNLYIAAMNGPLAISGTQVRISKPDFDWEKRGFWVNEAPAVIIKNGKVFITYSASATDSNYCMGLLTASATSNLLSASSWSKSSTPVFQSSDATSIYGPGSNTFTVGSDGTDINVYNARNYKNITGDPLFDPNRAIRAQVVNWNASGNPVFGTPVPDGSAGATNVNDNTLGTGNNQYQYTGTWSYGSQSGAYQNDNHWSNSVNANYQVRFNGTKIQLYGAKANNHGIAAVRIDTGAEVNVDFYSATRSDNTLLWTSPTLAAGNHTLRVRVTGTKNASSSNTHVTGDRVVITP
jgi:GH43 family beta-xylosidase